MVSIAISVQSTTLVGLRNKAAPSTTKCRYKTGKCLNERSNKRNGQPHQLCLYHRDKANTIQRKFDRQKRQAARFQKFRDSHGLSSPTSVTMVDTTDLSFLAHAAASPTGSTCSTSPTGSTCSTSSYLSYSSNGAEQSLSPDSPDCYRKERAWLDLPLSKTPLFGDLLVLQGSTQSHQCYLLSDEVEFLRSALMD
ncbi:hypothetical protein CCR75_004410 [Bremia lactucae]|uniref:Uncharacterized protein n=1 Tax=Bremia lactucae TaxID=4779 RepID=A0A976FRJ4_BRELC|nr:hypothetical protein CCR75_004410 [Bremia lactucae]